MHSCAIFCSFHLSQNRNAKKNVFPPTIPPTHPYPFLPTSPRHLPPPCVVKP